MSTIFTSHLAVALKAMAMDGRGVAWLPLSLVDEELGVQGCLVELGSGCRIEVDIVLLRPDGNLGSWAETHWDVLGDGISLA